MRIIKVEVTREDIVMGEPKNACNCPVARAIHRIEGYRTARVSHCQVEIADPIYRSLSRWFSLPSEAIHFIEDFDEGKLVHPFTFEMNVY